MSIEYREGLDCANIFVAFTPTELEDSSIVAYKCNTCIKLSILQRFIEIC